MPKANGVFQDFVEETFKTFIADRISVRGCFEPIVSKQKREDISSCPSSERVV